MGKKLTEAEKAAKKAEKDIKRRAFAARRRERDAVVEREGAARNLVVLSGAADAALAEREAEWKRGRDRMQALEEEFARRKEAMKDENDAKYAAARIACDQAFSAKRAAEREVESAVNAAFPDMVKAYGPAYWTPPEGYLGQFNEPSGVRLRQPKGD